jgi:E3 ubiquitin-protein ligase SHPRH
MAIFFRANAYFQIKSNEDITKPGTPEFEALEKLETDGYEEAKKLRQEILQEVSDQKRKNVGVLSLMKLTLTKS